MEGIEWRETMEEKKDEDDDMAMMEIMIDVVQIKKRRVEL